MRYLQLATLLALSTHCFCQNYFEGEITYRLEAFKKDSAFDLNSLRAAKATRSSFILKGGNFLQKPDSGSLQYLFFSRVENRIYSKYDWADTLFYQSGEQLPRSQDSAYTIEVKQGSDTILGYSCNRFILHTPNLTLTLIFAPELSIDKDWFKDTKYSYYNIIYANTHSLFLKSIAEFGKYVSILEAERIQRREVSNSEFPNTDLLPKALY